MQQTDNRMRHATGRPPDPYHATGAVTPPRHHEAVNSRPHVRTCAHDEPFRSCSGHVPAMCRRCAGHGGGEEGGDQKPIGQTLK